MGVDQVQTTQPPTMLATISQAQLREIGRQVCNSVTDLGRFERDIKSEYTHEAVGRAVLEIVVLVMRKG